jgi:LAS superfamily LD-carboxypeptidase LdcB
MPLKGSGQRPMQLVMSLQAAIARITEIQSALAPVQPAAPAAPATTGAPFANQLQTAMTPAAGAAAPQQAAPGTYSHLNGDLDGNPELLQRLEALAARRGETFNVTSGTRTIEEQQRLWDNRANNPFPVARPGTSRHQSGNATDVTIGGRPIQEVIPAGELRAAGLNPLAGDAVHVELP